MRLDILSFCYLKVGSIGPKNIALRCSFAVLVVNVNVEGES